MPANFTNQRSTLDNSTVNAESPLPNSKTLFQICRGGYNHDPTSIQHRITSDGQSTSNHVKRELNGAVLKPNLSYTHH